MAAINFPDSPSNGDTHVVGNVTYVYDNAKAKWNGAGQTPNDRLTEGSNSLEITSGNDLVWTGDNVGINDTSPDNKLHITTTSSSAYSTNITNTSNLTNALLKLQNLDGSDGTGADNYVGIQFSVANGATSTAQLQYVRTGDNAGKFEFKARNGSTSYPNLLTLKSNNDIGINKPDPQQWGGGVPTIEIKGTVATGGNSTRSGAIAFESGSGSDGYAVLWGQEGGIHIYTSATNRDAVAYSSKFHSDGNLHFASGKGIDFSANANATGMTSELLDDYEEGTFEPTFRADSGDFDTVVYHPDTGGRYVKIGNYVWVTGCVRVAGATITIGSPSNSDTLCIGNLPFNNNPRTNGDNADSHGVCRVPVWNGSQAPHFIQARQSVNFCNLYYISSLTGTSATNNVSHLTSQSMVQFTLAYTSD